MLQVQSETQFVSVSTTMILGKYEIYLHVGGSDKVFLASDKHLASALAAAIGQMRSVEHDLLSRLTKAIEEHRRL